MWAWLVWGREVGHLDLDTVGGPSWKPLPVARHQRCVALGGGAAPTVWLLVARTAGLLALVGVYRLGVRASPGVAAGLVAVAPPAAHARRRARGSCGWCSRGTARRSPPRSRCGRSIATSPVAAGSRCSCCSSLALDRPEAWPFLAVVRGVVLARRSRRALVSPAALLAARAGAVVRRRLVGFGEPVARRRRCARSSPSDGHRLVDALGTRRRHGRRGRRGSRRRSPSCGASPAPRPRRARARRRSRSRGRARRRDERGVRLRGAEPLLPPGGGARVRARRRRRRSGPSPRSGGRAPVLAPSW